MKNRNLQCFFAFLVFVLSFFESFSQESIGMSTGNYSGVSGVWFNPANIADSRYKFDINLIGVNSYYNNNYLLVDRTAVARRLFLKEPYNSSFDAVKNDLLQEQWPVNGKVKARLETVLHFPLSFMATTGKKSAIAFRMTNRTVNQVEDMNADLARLLFFDRNYPDINGKDIRMDSASYRFLNWQEIAFTYSRVLLNGDHHFLKLGLTVKWLGANSGGYIQTDNAVINFKDSNTLSVSSPLIQYARTERADIGAFSRRDILNNLEDQSFGWDAGLVYEFRAKVKKFKYIDQDLEEQQRRDLNKYLFRVGVSLVDMGKFTLNKKLLTNDHSANFVNWDFSEVGAHNFSDFDTAYSKQITYIPGAPNSFTFRLPAAIIANLDLHLFGGFYINAAIKAPFDGFKNSTNTFVSANRWVAVTPRFESRFFGLYVPVSRSNKITNIGATIRLGPLYFGSNNLAEILTNKSTYEGDYHAGIRFPIAYGKPNRLNKALESMLSGKQDAGKSTSSYQYQIDSLKKEMDFLNRKLNDSTRNKNIQILINNNGVTSAVTNTLNDSIVIQNRISEQEKVKFETYSRQQTVITDTLIRQLAQKNIEAENLKKSAEQEKAGKKKTKSKKSNSQPTSIETSNDELEREVERLRRQMEVQNAAIIGGGTAAVIATANNGKDKKTSKTDSAKVSTTDTLKAANIEIDSTVQSTLSRPDTLHIRDTVYVNSLQSITAYKVVENQKIAPVLFDINSSVISTEDKTRLQDLAEKVKSNEGWRVELTGMTDARGSIDANRKVAAARYNAVSGILLRSGVKDNQIIIRSKLADTNNIPGHENPRRVEIRILEH